jgi:hypothetical protein
MAKKLYRVDVCLYVMAEDESEACWAATASRFDVFECVAAEAETLEAGWAEAVPYNNSEDDRTCAEILTDQRRGLSAGIGSIKLDRRPEPGTTYAGSKQPGGLGAGWLRLKQFICRLAGPEIRFKAKLVR